MTAPMSAELTAHYAGGSRTIALCFKATLTNGTVVAATKLDEDITYDGVTYQSVAGFIASDVESGSDLSPDNMEIEGFLRAPAVTEEDARSGRWDYASILLFEVNWRDLTMGHKVVRYGKLGEVRLMDGRFVAEFRGLMQHYSRRIVNLTTPTCLRDLGDAGCGISLAAWTVTGSVLSVTNNRQISDATRTEAANRFVGGKLTWTSGLNNGLSMEVKSSSLGSFELVEAMPFTIAAGDTYSMHAGCTKRFTEDCKDKFGNGVNFLGVPPHLMPGHDVYRRGGVGA